MDTKSHVLFPQIKKTTCGQAVCGCWEGHNLSHCMADPLDAISEDEDGTMFENMPGTWEDAELEPVLSWLHATVACNR